MSRIRPWQNLAILVLLGLAIRLYLAPAPGHVVDLQTFSRWATIAASNPWNQLYEKANASYPPGLMLFFELVGRACRKWVTHDPDQIFLRVALKLPAIIFDLLGGIISYLLARRFVTDRMAVGAAALFILNPALIYDSAYWGQIDSITSVCSLIAVWLIICGWRRSAWCVLAFAVLNKPPVVLLAPLFAIEALIGDDDNKWKRYRQTVEGILGGFAIAYLVAFPFYTDHSLAGVYRRLFSSYQNFSSLYPFNSANAFNLYAIFSEFFRPDTKAVLGIPLKLWGYEIFLIVLWIVIIGYINRRSPIALIESSFLVMLALFLFFTEMHERYLIYALTLVLPLAVLNRRYLWAAGILTLTLLINLEYGLNYMWIEMAKPSGMNIHEYAPVLSHLCALANLGVFAGCAYAYVRKTDASTEQPERACA